ncbi:hypothetical protein OpiT1DRAFT_01259 [Opitutaceae bacterium TAV1]|nr:hypothetical protein OpiT1DRAFT_01259 [Opitutaceae bacterium TAV1]
MTLIDYAEKRVDDLMAAQMEDMACIANDARFTFGFIAAAISALLGYAFSLMGDKAMSEWPWVFLSGIAAVVVWLFAWGWYLVNSAMMARGVMHRGNEPKNLLNEEMKKHPVDLVREGECLQLQARIEYNRARNKEAGHALNRVRLALLAAPVVFVLAMAATVASGG